MRGRSYGLTVDLNRKVTTDRLTLTITYILTGGLGPYQTGTSELTVLEDWGSPGEEQTTQPWLQEEMISNAL